MSLFDRIITSLHGRRIGLDKDYNLIARGIPYNPRVFGGDANLAALQAFRDNETLFLDGTDAVFTIDKKDCEDTNLARHAYLARVVAWQAKAICTNGARLILQFADGLYAVDAWNALGSPYSEVHVRGANSPLLDIRGADITDIPMASISYGARSGDNYPVTVVAASALPSYVVPGYALGMRNVTGGNDARALNGALTVLTIDSGRTTITGMLKCPRVLDLVSPSPTTDIDTTSTYQTMPASRIRVPSACIAVNTSYNGLTEVWTGSALEGYFNFQDGGCGEFRNIGMSWVGGDDPTFNQKLIYVRDSGSRWYAQQGVVLSGAGQACIRGYGGAEITLNYACIGGGGTAEDCVTFQGASMCQVIRCCIGGCENDVILVGEGSHLSLQASILASGDYGVLVTGAGAGASVLASTVTCSQIGLWADYGSIQVGSSTLINKNDLGLSWAPEGFIRGAPTLSANTRDSLGPPNVLFAGGGWYQNTAIGLRSSGGILLPETDALLSAMATAPGRARQFLIDDTIKALKDAGLWDLILALWVLASHDNQSALGDWKAPTSRSLTTNSAPVFTVDKGVAGDGVDDWLDSGVTLASLTGYAQNDAGMFAYSLTDVDGIGRDIGTASSFNASVCGRASGNFLTRANDGTTGTTAVANSVGLSGWTRVASGTYSQYRAGSVIATPAVASTGVPTSNVSLLRASTAFSTRQIAAAGVTKGLTADQIASLNTILSYHLAEVGAI